MGYLGKKSFILTALASMFAGIFHHSTTGKYNRNPTSTKTNPREYKRRILTQEEADEKRYLNYGLKKWPLSDGGYLFALNKKNAVRKAGNKNTTICF